MSKFTNPLNNIKIASPCSQDWAEMIGTERKRFCGECKLNVYNLSGMSQEEAENLLMNSEGRLCVRFFKRADGTVLTKDCPVGWQAIKRRVSKTTTAFASLFFAALSGIGLANYFTRTSSQPTMGTMTPNIEKYTMGDMAIDDTNSNIAIQGKPIATMGNISIEQKGEFVGMRVAPVSRQTRKNLQRK